MPEVPKRQEMKDKLNKRHANFKGVLDKLPYSQRHSAVTELQVEEREANAKASKRRKTEMFESEALLRKAKKLELVAAKAAGASAAETPS